MLRLLRITLFVLVPTFALAAAVTGCDDDSSAPAAHDMAVHAGDMAKPVVVHDMAQTD